jgi:hypothetical protein
MGTAKGSHSHGGADRVGTYPIKQPAPAPAPANTSTGKHAHPHVHPQTDWRDWRSPFGTARRAQTPATDDDMHTHAPRPARAAAPKPAPVLSSLQLCKPPTQATTQALQSSPPSPASPASRSIHPRRRRRRRPRPLPIYPLSTAHCPLPTAHCPLPTAHCPLPGDLGNPHHLIRQVPAPTHPRIHAPTHASTLLSIAGPCARKDVEIPPSTLAQDRPLAARPSRPSAPLLNPLLLAVGLMRPRHLPMKNAALVRGLCCAHAPVTTRPTPLILPTHCCCERLPLASPWRLARVAYPRPPVPHHPPSAAYPLCCA